MGTKSIGWYILLFGVVVGIADYFGAMDYLFGNPTEPLNFYSWILTPLAWSAVALIIVGTLMIKFGHRRYPMPRYQ